MSRHAELLTEDEIELLDGYSAALPRATNAVAPAHLKREDGRWLALYGDWPNRRLPACQQCHGPLGIGAGEQFPAPAEQPDNYLVGQLARWGTGERKGDHDGMMGVVAARLSMAEARQVSDFYASLPAQDAIRVATEISTGEQVPSAAALTPSGQGISTAPAPRVSPRRRWRLRGHPRGSIAPPRPAPSGRELAKGSSYFEPPRRGA